MSQHSASCESLLHVSNNEDSFIFRTTTISSTSESVLGNHTTNTTSEDAMAGL